MRIYQGCRIKTRKRRLGLGPAINACWAKAATYKGLLIFVRQPWRIYLKGFILLGVAGLANAAPLTPPNEPKDDSFYVCYEQRHVHHSVRAPLATYRKYKYFGCSVNRMPCNTLCAKRTNCPSATLKLFGWFNNYPQTLNAFYRCAYS